MGFCMKCECRDNVVSVCGALPETPPDPQFTYGNVKCSSYSSVVSGHQPSTYSDFGPQCIGKHISLSWWPLLFWAFFIDS